LLKFFYYGGRKASPKNHQVLPERLRMEAQTSVAQKWVKMSHNVIDKETANWR